MDLPTFVFLLLALTALGLLVAGVAVLVGLGWALIAGAGACAAAASFVRAGVRGG